MSFTRSQWDAFLKPGGGLVAVDDAAADAEALLGERLGVYRLTGIIGSGGMATVYDAQRDDGHFEQAVAIKLVHAGMEDEGLRRRFVQERQILARLDHPGIARVFDGGVTEDGRPYLVMDRVEGQAIDAWCEDRDADAATRVDLLLQVADAVAHAHGHLVVHCDLKPGNILVGDDGRVRLLDFGIARVFAAEAADAGGGGLRPMTPLYSAPEQLRGEEPQVATDIWQVGVLACELLSGIHPWRDAAGELSTLADRILNRPAPVPSQIATEIARRRMGGLSWPDLDAIVARGLAAGPEDRYRGMTDLAADLEALRRRRPVAAREGGNAYRLGRLIDRNRVAVGALGALAVVLVGLAWWSEHRVTSERQRADAIAAFVGSLTASSDPLAGRFRAQELISVSGFEPPPSISADPVVQREFVLLTGQSLLNLGEYRRVIALVEPLVTELQSAAPAAGDPRLHDYLSLLGYARFRAGDPAAGREELTRALEGMASAEPEDRSMLRLTARRLAQLERQSGSPARARDALARVLGRDDRLPEAAQAWLDLGVAAGEATDYATAAAALETTIELAPEGSLRVLSMATLADVERLAGNLDRAADLATRSVAMAGNDPGMRAVALTARGNLHRARLEPAGAIDDYRSALGLLRVVPGESDPQTGRVMTALALVLAEEGRCAEAVDLTREATALGHLDREAPDLRQRLQRLVTACS